MDLINVVEIAPEPVAGAPGVTRQTLLAVGEPRPGRIEIFLASPGATVRAETGEAVGADRVAYVIAGTALYGSGERPRTLGPGDALYLPGGSSADLRAAGEESLRLLWVSGRSWPLPRSVAGSEIGAGPVVIIGGSVPTNRRDDLENGFWGVDAAWYVSEDTVDSRDVVFAPNAFDAEGGVHALHRHHRADEFILFLEGHGSHLSAAGEIGVGAGQLTYMPAGEWHGFATAPGVRSRGLFGYLGVGSLRAGGYELLASAAGGTAG